MINIHFLTQEDILVGQIEQLSRYGGGKPGLRDKGLLESAVQSVQATFAGQYLLADVYAMGAAYLRYLVLDHPFENGNKRSALASALEFLYLNGVRVEATDVELVDLVLGVIAHTATDEQVAAFLEAHGEPNEELRPGATEKARQILLSKARNWEHFLYARAFARLAE